MTRLRTVSAQGPGWRRRRRGRGFSYEDEAGHPLAAEDVDRVRALVIPPAWEDVWICPHERGHLQAVGTDEAGRRQYLYHPEWRRKKDLEKHERTMQMAAKLPRVRRQLRVSLPGEVPGRTGVLDLTVRLIDLGCFRIGSDDYTENYGSFGLSTLELRHVRRTANGYTFSYVGKSGIEQEVLIDDPLVVESLARLTRRRDPSARLLAFREGRSWVPLGPDEVNERVRELFGLDVTSKDFRTWHATVAATLALGQVERAATRTGRARQVRTAYEEAAELLGNTVAVAKSSYVNPRVVDLFESGNSLAEALTRLPRDPDRLRDRLDRIVLGLLG